MNRCRPIPRIFAALLLIGLASSSIYAKDIKLGGEQKQGKLPPNMIVLPPIMVMIRGEDGGWKHIKIDAWLAGTDVDNAKRLDALKNTIRDKADRELPNRNFEILQSAGQGSTEAKKVIHAAVEAGLGAEWKGDVLIRNMLVY
ncbi:MAG TPA: hypothetical protein VKP60_04275 [Magnetospirillaceae bacterium]|nr:hypothetical protein [Magnetospirillaceae bacterium]